MGNYSFQWFETWLKIYPGVLLELAGRNTCPQNANTEIENNEQS